MKSKLSVGCIQLNSKSSIIKNLENTISFSNLAVNKGAEFLFTPEVSNIISLNQTELLDNVYEEKDDPFLKTFKEFCFQKSVWVLLGSLVIRDKKNKLYNRSYLINNKGKIVSKYDKIHMFDANISKVEKYSESKVFKSGTDIKVSPTPWGKLGLSICYDIRFPELYRQLNLLGAKMISIPAAFTIPTGKVHWKVLLQSRAIENGCFIFAPAQCGVNTSKRKTYGHTMIISPWGKVIGEMKKKPGILVKKIDLSEVAKTREKIASDKSVLLKKRIKY